LEQASFLLVPCSPSPLLWIGCKASFLVHIWDGAFHLRTLVLTIFSYLFVHMLPLSHSSFEPFGRCRILSDELAPSQVTWTTTSWVSRVPHKGLELAILRGIDRAPLLLNRFDLIEGVTQPRGHDGAPHVVLRWTIEPNTGVTPFGWANCWYKIKIPSLLPSRRWFRRLRGSPIEYQT
jgi:hypothetical protein